MKTMLVDAWNTFVTEKGVDTALFDLCESFQNPKIILTNANPEERIQFGIVDMPYEVFSLEHNPNETDPHYFEIFLERYNLSSRDVVYFEHNPDAVISARSLWIETHHFDKDIRDIESLRLFLQFHLQ